MVLVLWNGGGGGRLGRGGHRTPSLPTAVGTGVCRTISISEECAIRSALSRPMDAGTIAAITSSSSSALPPSAPASVAFRVWTRFTTTLSEKRRIGGMHAGDTERYVIGSHAWDTERYVIGSQVRPGFNSSTIQDPNSTPREQGFAPKSDPHSTAGDRMQDAMAESRMDKSEPHTPTDGVAPVTECRMRRKNPGWANASPMQKLHR
jgi:hypothetical protein